MNNYKELIERLRTESLYKDKATLEIMDLCMETADVLEALAMENCGLKANKAIMEKILEGKHNPHDMALITQTRLQIVQLRTELEQVTRERDAAVNCIYDIEDALNASHSYC